MRRLSITLFLLIAGAVMLADFVFAAEPGTFARILGVGYPDMRLVVIRVLQIVWLFVTVAAVGFVIYGYVQYRRADPEDLTEEPRAKRMMLYGGIAAGVSLLLFLILTIAYVLIERGYTVGRTEPRKEEIVSGLGGRIVIHESLIRDHYPVRDEQNVVRDTAILITFAEKIKKESILDATNALKGDSVLIRRSTPSQTGDYGVVAATGVLSVDGTVVKILPSKLLGEPDQKVSYTVALTEGIQKESGQPLFSQGGGGYSWSFEVSGVIDNTPPTVETYFPLAHSRNPINTLIQITFSEPIDPFTISADSIGVFSGAPGKQQAVVGSWSVGNGYRTVTFFSANSCGTNQCGNTVFCLAGSDAYTTRAKAAALKGKQNTRDNPNKALFPYTGIVDTAGNSLDGGGANGIGRNGKSDGAEIDDFMWDFSTSSEKETTPPTIISIAPGRDAQGISVTAPVTVIFSKFMDITSLNTVSIGFSRELGSWISSMHIFSEHRTRAQIHHEPFKTNEMYTPVIKSGVTDIYQNCYNPCVGPGVAQSLLPKQ